MKRLGEYALYTRNAQARSGHDAETPIYGERPIYATYAMKNVFVNGNTTLQLQPRATANTRPTRTSCSPGFYQALNTFSIADVFEQRQPCDTGKRENPRVFAEVELPEDCFIVESR